MTDHQELFEQARDAAAQGDFEVARELYRQLWETPAGHNDKEISLNYAYTLEQTGDRDGALSAYKDLIGLYDKGPCEDEQAITEESMVRLRELMAEADHDQAGQIIDHASDETEAFVINQLFDHGQTRALQAGEILCSKGDQASHMWLLTKGTLDVIIPGEPMAHLTAELERPCLVGELAYYTGMRRAATLCAATSVTVIELSFDQISELLSDNEQLLAMLDHLFRHRLVMQVLSKHEIFKLFNEPDRRRVTMRFENTVFQAGETLIAQGEEHPCTYMVQAGTVLLIRDVDGQEQLLGSVHPGDLFHLGGMLRGVQSPYRAIAGTPTLLLKLPRNSFEPFMMQRPWLIKAILKHSRLSAEQQILHPKERNIWDADRYINMKEKK